MVQIYQTILPLSLTENPSSNVTDSWESHDLKTNIDNTQNLKVNYQCLLIWRANEKLSKRDFFSFHKLVTERT